jgi:hypothetical protein
MWTSCMVKQLTFVSIVAILVVGACNLGNPGGELDSDTPPDTSEDQSDDRTEGGDNDEPTDPPADDETDTHTPNPLTVTFQKEGSSSASATTVTIPIRHFSAAGAVEASDTEVQDQQEDHPPTDVEDWAEQELATDPTIETEVAVLRGVHAQTLATIASAGSSPILMDQAFAQMRFWKLKYNTARGEVRTRLAGLDAELIAQFVTTFELALVQAKTACRAHDLSQIGRLLRWSYLVLTYPDISAALTDSQSIRDDAVDCAQFELEFQSRIDAISHEDPITTAVSGTIPIGAAVGAVTGISLEGEGALGYTRTTYFDTEDCNTTVSGRDGLLRVLRVDLGLNLGGAGTSSTGPGGLPALDLGVHLAPEGLTESVRMVCSGTVLLDQQTQHWAGGWAALHLAESSPGGFEIRGWIPGNAGDPVVGTKAYSGGDEAFIEQSQLRLIHRPAL